MGKAPGQDDITTDHIYDARDILHKGIARLFTQCVKERKVPKDLCLVVYENYIEIIKIIYENGIAIITLHKDTNAIKIVKGVRQGDTISPELFAEIHEIILCKTD